MLEPHPNCERRGADPTRFPTTAAGKLRTAGYVVTLGLLTLGLVACAEQQAPAKAVATASTPGGVTGDFEVVYRGASTRYQADNRSCPSPGLVTLRPTQGAFTYRLGGRVRIETTIIGDGTLVGEGDGYTLTGTATEQKIEGEVRNGKCAYHFRAFRKS